MSVPGGRVPWHLRPALWLRNWRARREQRKRSRDLALQVQAWKHRADTGEDICIGCGGYVQRLRVSSHFVTVRDRCARCVGDRPVISVAHPQCTVCGRKDCTRTISVPVEMNRARISEFAELVAGPCPDCMGRISTPKGRS